MAKKPLDFKDLITFCDENKVIFFRDKKNLDDLYADVPANGNNRKVYNLYSSEFYRWIVYRSAKFFGRIPTTTRIKEFIDFMSGQVAHEEADRDIFLRVHGDNEKIYYDLHTSDNKVIEITSDGWEITTNPDLPFYFASHSIQEEQPLPVQVDSPAEVIRETVADMVNIVEDGQALLFCSFIGSLLVPCSPHYIMNLHGQAGAGKTSVARFVKSLIDPTSTTLSSLGNNRNDMNNVIVNCMRNYFVVFDNLSRISKDESDLLAQMVTGTAIPQRKLYSNFDLVYVRLERPFLLSGIEKVVKENDLLRRTLLFEIETSPQNVGDKRYNELVERNKPRLLGAYFTVISNALKNMNQYKKDFHTTIRFTEHELWMYALYTELGGNPDSFFPLLFQQIQEHQSIISDNNPILAWIIELVVNSPGLEWEGTPTELLAKMGEMAKEKNSTGSWDMPKQANTLSRMINTGLSVFQENNIEVSYNRTNTARTVCFKLTSEEVI